MAGGCFKYFFLEFSHLRNSEILIRIFKFSKGVEITSWCIVSMNGNQKIITLEYRRFVKKLAIKTAAKLQGNWSLTWGTW